MPQHHLFKTLNTTKHTYYVTILILFYIKPMQNHQKHKNQVYVTNTRETY
jgi:hypothetical protein